MSKKDYERAVKIIQSLFDNDTTGTTASTWIFRMVVDTFVEFFTDDNPQFDRTRFLKACVKKNDLGDGETEKIEWS